MNILVPNHKCHSFFAFPDQGFGRSMALLAHLPGNFGLKVWSFIEFSKVYFCRVWHGNCPE